MQLCEPSSLLTGCVTGLPTSGLRTVVLPGFVIRTGNEMLAATAAFASDRLAAHCEPHLKETQLGRKRNFKPPAFFHLHCAADNSQQLSTAEQVKHAILRD